MSAMDFLHYAFALIAAHKYMVIAFLVVFEGILVMTIVQRVVVAVSREHDGPGCNVRFASNALRNAVIMGGAIILLAGFDAAWISTHNKELLVTPIHWSVTMASLVSAVLINGVAWLTLKRVRDGLTQ